MVEGPCTVINDYEWLVKNAQQGKTEPTCQPLWEELYAAAAGKDIEYAWRKRDQTLGSRLAHQLARDAARVNSLFAGRAKLPSLSTPGAMASSSVPASAARLSPYFSRNFSVALLPSAMFGALTSLIWW